VERLTRAFRRHGYDAATLARLSQETGLVKASLYHYFPGGKTDMARAVMDRAADWLEGAVLAPLRGPGTPAERIEAMTRALDAYYAGGRESCLLGVMVVGDGRDAVSGHVRAALRTWIESLADALREAGVDPIDADARAEDAVVRVQGAVTLARGLGDVGPFRRLMEALPDQLLRGASLRHPGRSASGLL